MCHSSTRPPNVQVCHGHMTSFTRSSPVLVLQVTNAGVRRPGYEAKCPPCVSSCVPSHYRALQCRLYGAVSKGLASKESSLTPTLRSEYFADVSTECFSLWKTEAFSQNVCKVFRSQSWYQRTLFYAGAN